MKPLTTLVLFLGILSPFARQASRVIYICPMDAGIRENAPGDCPKCGMALVPSTPDEFTQYLLEVRTSPLAPLPGRAVELRFIVRHPVTNETIDQFVLFHEKLFHLFIVSQDLNHFDHVHPQLQPDGSFRLTTVFPQPGYYQLVADFIPEGGTPQMIQKALTTAGYRGKLRHAVLRPDAGWTKIQDGLKMELAGGPLVEKKELLLSLRISEAATGRSVDDLELYLGAWGHMLIVSDDLADIIHVHPAPETKPGGPDIAFGVRFPRPRDYRIWVQFQRRGKVHTTSFIVRAQEVGVDFLRTRTPGGHRLKF